MRRTHLVLILIFAATAQAGSAQVPRRPFLFKDARGELAAARAIGDSAVTLVIAAMPGRNARVARVVSEMGGTVRFRDDDVDYLRARVPVDRVEALVAHADVHSVDISFSGRSRSFGLAAEPRPAAPLLPSPGTLPMAIDTPPAWPPVLSDYPLTRRYDPLGDLNAIEFRRANPTFDGRGTTLGIIDLSLDPLLPELQIATTLEGEPTRKIIAYEAAIDADEEDDGRWLRMDESVTAPAATFTYRDSTYSAPRPGTYRIAMFDEAVFDSLSRSGIDKDVNRDGNPEGSSRIFAVIWDETSNNVWVDTDQDLSFTDEKPLTDYSVRPEFGVFGTDDPSTPVRETVGFGIQIDRTKGRVALNLGVASHASLVIGAAAASRGTAGRFDGVAPGARIANFPEGGTAYGQTEAVIRAMKHPDVDVVFLEQSSLITRNYLLRDGRLVPTVIYSRLIEKYRKPLIVPTHNYPVLGAPDDFVLAAGAIGVGGHESRDNFFSNHGVRVEHADNLLITGGYGPMGNGALAPDIIAPSNYVSTSRGFEEGRAIAGLFQLPPGYTIAGGTSTATPTTAASVALLISAAKQTDVEYDAFRLKHVIASSARWVPHLPAYKQGNGVVDVAAAWEMLRTMDAEDGRITITSRGPVRHVLSHMLPTPNEGVGLYERDGWTAGDRGQRVIHFTRTSGPRQPMTFSLSWVGNDSSTFSAPDSVTLPLNRTVPVTLEIAPASPGAHTALLTLEHPDVPGHAYRTLATIVAAQPLNVENEYTVETETEIPRPGMRSFFYRVPEGVTALRIDLDAPDRAVGLTVVRPDTRSESATRTLEQRTGKQTVLVANPMAGMWEMRITDIADTREFDWEQAQKPEPVPPTKATLTVSALATELAVAPGTDVLPADGVESASFEVSIANRMAAFTGGAVSVFMGSARRDRPVIADREQQVYEVDVPAGATALSTRVEAVERDADLDVYIFDCSGKQCRPARADGDPSGPETATVLNPAAGTWKIVVDAASVPSGSTAYAYLDVVFAPSYGMVAIADPPEERGIGARWTAKARTWVAGPLGMGRVPYAALFVQAKGAEDSPLDAGEISVNPMLLESRGSR